MNIEFTTEDYIKILFQHSKFWGKLKMIVNGTEVKINNLPHFSAGLTKSVGAKVENHEVRVDITRPLILPAIRKGWKYIFYIDDKEVKNITQ